MTYSSDSEQTSDLLDRVAGGSKSAMEELLQLYRPYLRRLVSARISPELKRRVDPSDVIQDAQLAIASRINDFLERRPTSFRIWIRRKALQLLVDYERRHIVAKKRSVRREKYVADSSVAIARVLVSDTPSKILRRNELQKQIREAIDQLESSDRDILALRHAEGLSNAEAADLLDLTPNTARQRYGRALRRLHQELARIGVELDGA
ncbi:MAG: sigma-70 family RNA polymerase sigma factor [Planctomycetales bacterium]|nr:sigma-70 family RNA polymerase sigma factor [Planctomycetales bacterium]